MSEGQTLLRPGVGLKQDVPEPPQIKEEPEEQSVKQEEEPLPVFRCVPESRAVCVKTEESSLLQQRQSEDREGTQGVDISSESHTSDDEDDEHLDPQMETEADGDKSQTKDRDTAAQNSKALSSKNKSAAESTVNNGHTSGAERRKEECPFCQKRFMNKGNLEIHIRVHTGERPFTCAECKKTFPLKGNLQRHMRIHSGVEKKMQECPFCQKIFRTKQMVQRHIRVHTGEKPYCCTVCEKAFTQRSTLQTHMKAHTGEAANNGDVSDTDPEADEKKHQCSICRKRFISKQTLQIHVRIHTGERPYSCLICNKTFTQKAHHEMHKRTHTGDKPFSCALCSSTFSQKSNLKTHMRKKHFSCSPEDQLEPHLKRDFTDSSSLREHLQTQLEEQPSRCLSPRLLERTAAASQRRLLDSALTELQLRAAGVPSLSPGLGLTQDVPEPPQIKEEPEEQSLKQEEEPLPV